MNRFYLLVSFIMKMKKYCNSRQKYYKNKEKYTIYKCYTDFYDDGYGYCSDYEEFYDRIHAKSIKDAICKSKYTKDIPFEYFTIEEITIEPDKNNNNGYKYKQAIYNNNAKHINAYKYYEMYDDSDEDVHIASGTLIRVCPSEVEKYDC